MNRNKTALGLVMLGIALSISSAALAKSNDKGSDIIRDSSIAVLTTGIAILKGQDPDEFKDDIK